MLAYKIDQVKNLFDCDYYGACMRHVVYTDCLIIQY